MSAAGGLDARVRLERPAAALDDLGANAGFEPAGEVWARVEPQSLVGAAEPFEGRGRGRLTLTLRAPSPVAPGWRAILAGTAYRVRARAPADPRAAFVQLDCEEELT